MELHDIKIGDEIREKSTGEVWEVAQVSPIIWIKKGKDEDMISFEELNFFEHEFPCKKSVETLEKENKNLHESFDKLLNAFIKLSDLNNKLIKKLLN